MVTTNATSLRCLQSNDLSSALCSKFVKINELFFKTNLLQAFILVDLKLCFCSSPLIKTMIKRFTTQLT